MSRARRFSRGRPLTLDEAIGEILANRYIFHNHKPLHPGWTGSWSLRQIILATAGGTIFQAIENPHEPRSRRPQG